MEHEQDKETVGVVEVLGRSGPVLGDDLGRSQHDMKELERKIGITKYVCLGFTPLFCGLFGKTTSRICGIDSENVLKKTQLQLSAHSTKL